MAASVAPMVVDGIATPGADGTSTLAVIDSTAVPAAATVTPKEILPFCIFEPELDLKYSCPICLGLLCKPVQTSCGHRFCRGCYRRAIRTQPSSSRTNGNRPVCPVDKTTVDTVFEDVAVAREIMSLVVLCRQRDAGCPWTGEYRNVETHQDVCDFEPIPCRLNCPTLVLRKDMDSHVDYCPKRREPCKLCGKIILPWDLKHLFFECPNMPIPCVYCERRLRRDMIADHTDPLRGDCPGQEVHCRYYSLGCTVQCQRKDLSGHNELFRQEHMVLMLQRIEHLENKVQTLEAKSSEQQ